MVEFAKNLVCAFVFIAAILVVAIGVGIGPILVMMWLGIPPMPFGLPAIGAAWCFVGALAFAVEQHRKTP